MSSSNETVRLHAFIDGLVQGVGFRMFVQDYAHSFGLTGFVRNTYDGQVEVVAEGDHQTLENLLQKLRTGPRAAFVTKVNQEWMPATGEFSRFEIRRTE
ncbi:MAG: acylphosphatase [Chloroflexi bacterium]|nr:acylphosphatase [Chloroflexota bacterium]